MSVCIGCLRQNRNPTKKKKRRKRIVKHLQTAPKCCLCSGCSFQQHRSLHCEHATRRRSHLSTELSCPAKLGTNPCKQLSNSSFGSQPCLLAFWWGAKHNLSTKKPPKVVFSPIARVCGQLLASGGCISVQKSGVVVRGGFELVLGDCRARGLLAWSFK